MYGDGHRSMVKVCWSVTRLNDFDWKDQLCGERTRGKNRLRKESLTVERRGDRSCLLLML
jgi:hypothetical protein